MLKICLPLPSSEAVQLTVPGAVFCYLQLSQYNWFRNFYAFALKTIWPTENACRFADGIFKPIELIYVFISFRMLLNSPMVSLSMSISGSCDGLAPNMRQAIIWNKDGLVCWRIYVSHSRSSVSQFSRHPGFNQTLRRRAWLKWVSY